MFMVASSVVLTVVVLNYHHRTADIHEMPPWVNMEFMNSKRLHNFFICYCSTVRPTHSVSRAVFVWEMIDIAFYHARMCRAFLPLLSIHYIDVLHQLRSLARQIFISRSRSDSRARRRDRVCEESIAIELTTILL